MGEAGGSNKHCLLTFLVFIIGGTFVIDSV